jgi:hypothetical protein
MWWAVYPRKQGDKAKIEKKFDELSNADKSACYLGTLLHAEKNPQWGDKQFIPMPATFLNQKRWNDEIAPSNREEIKDRAVTGEMIEMVWHVLTEMYGEQFIKLHGKEPPELWKKFLRPLSEQRIKRGLRATMDRCKEFPPSLPQFVGFCSPTFGEEHPALPAPEAFRDPDKAAAAFKEMLDILGVE